MKSLNHPEIEDLLFFVDPETKNVVATKKSDPKNQENWFIAFGFRTTVDPSLYNLFSAASILYQTLSSQYGMMQILIECIECLPKSPEVEKVSLAFIEMQNAMLLAQSVAQVGIEEVANTLDKGSKSS